KGVLITGSKLKAFRNPQPSWGFSVHKKSPDDCSGLSFYMLENQWQCNGPTENKICDNKGI
ncbi:hypothetical protein, partial [Escherichia coli]|uniref:hypothetical protein n=1 Tax=Escherichia coli TaxID=562 RepID=UPI001BC89CEE